MIALSAACCARLSPPGRRASNLCSRPGTGSLRLKRTWKQKPCGLLSLLRTWQSFIPPVPFSSGMGCGRRATTALACTCRSMWRKILLKKNGPCYSTGSGVCVMPISTRSWLSAYNAITSLYKYVHMIYAWLKHIDILKYPYEFPPRLFRCKPLWSRIQELTLINHICEPIGQDTSVNLSVLDYDQGWPQIWPHMH